MENKEEAEMAAVQREVSEVPKATPATLPAPLSLEDEMLLAQYKPARVGTRPNGYGSSSGGRCNGYDDFDYGDIRYF